MVYKNIFQEFSDNSDNTSALNEKINASLGSVGVPVIELPSGKAKLNKFSVITTNKDAEFVNMFQSEVDDIWYVSCQSRICQQHFSKKKRITTLDNSNICEHLSLFKTYRQNNFLVQGEMEEDLEENNAIEAETTADEDIDFLLAPPAQSIGDNDGLGGLDSTKVSS